MNKLAKKTIKLTDFEFSLFSKNGFCCTDFHHYDKRDGFSIWNNKIIIWKPLKLSFYYDYLAVNMKTKETKRVYCSQKSPVCLYERLI